MAQHIQDDLYPELANAIENSLLIAEAYDQEYSRAALEEIKLILTAVVQKVQETTHAPL